MYIGLLQYRMDCFHAMNGGLERYSVIYENAVPCKKNDNPAMQPVMQGNMQHMNALHFTMHCCLISCMAMLPDNLQYKDAVRNGMHLYIRTDIVSSSGLSAATCFPYLREMLRVENLCRLVGFDERQTAMSVSASCWSMRANFIRKNTSGNLRPERQVPEW